MLNALGASNQSIRGVDLFITNRCSLSCKYCFHKQNSKDLTLEQGKKYLDCLRKLDNVGDEVVINFFGGEPLLLPDLVKDLIEYGNATWKDRIIHYFISTNGVFFDEDYFKYLKSKNVSLQISADGDKETQNKNRGQADIVIENIKKIAKIIPNVVVRLTYSAEDITKLASNVEFIHSLGVKNIMHHNIMEIPWTEEDITDYLREFWKLYYLMEKYEDLTVHFVEYPMKVLLRQIPSEAAHCGTGQGMIAIQTNGDVYPCHRAASNDIFKLGNIETGFNRGIFLTLSKNAFEKCKDCTAKDVCHSCAMCNYTINGAFSEPLEWQCKIALCEHKITKQIADRKALTSLNDTVMCTAENVYEMAKAIERMEHKIDNMERK
jgi:uncharacterized protein